MDFKKSGQGPCVAVLCLVILMTYSLSLLSFNRDSRSRYSLSLNSLNSWRRLALVIIRVKSNTSLTTVKSVAVVGRRLSFCRHSAALLIVETMNFDSRMRLMTSSAMFCLAFSSLFFYKFSPHAFR